MDIQTYLSETQTTKADFARSIGVSGAVLYQWIKGLRPVAISHCKKINIQTNGLVTLRELRPSDWERIWPEVAVNEHISQAQPVPIEQESAA